MTRPLSVALPFAAALALGGCATAVPPVEVTRFHTNAVAGWAPGPRSATAPAPLDGPGPEDPGAAAIPPPEEHRYRPAAQTPLQAPGQGTERRDGLKGQ